MPAGSPSPRNVAVAARSLALALLIVALYVVVVTRGEVLHRVGAAL